MPSKKEENKLTFDIFVQKATNAMKRKRNIRKFKIKFESFTQDDDGEPIENDFKALDEAEVNDCLAQSKENDITGRNGDKYAVYIASINPSLKEIARQLMDNGVIETPLEVMNMFEPYEITQAATIIMEESGISPKKGKNATLVERGINNLKNL